MYFKNKKCRIYTACGVLQTPNETLNNTKEEIIKFCQNCENKIDDNAKFCSCCGNTVGAAIESGTGNQPQWGYVTNAGEEKKDNSKLKLGRILGAIAGFFYLWW